MAQYPRLPSHTKPKTHPKLPPGCMPVWVVSAIVASTGGFVSSQRLAVFADEDIAYAFADGRARATRGHKIKVDRKAAIRLSDGKVYLVYVAPVAITDEQPFEPRLGALRGFNTHGGMVCANPGDPLFSTVTMYATELWDGEKWDKIENPF